MRLGEPTNRRDQRDILYRKAEVASAVSSCQCDHRIRTCLSSVEGWNLHSQPGRFFLVPSSLGGLSEDTEHRNRQHTSAGSSPSIMQDIEGARNEKDDGAEPVAPVRKARTQVQDASSDYVRSGERTILQLLEHGRHFEEQSVSRLIVAGIMAGSLITFGAALSVFLSTGIEELGVSRLFTALGFIVGFSAVIFTGSALFTEINVVVPIVLVRNFTEYGSGCIKCLRFWAIVFLSNGLGAMLVASMMKGADVFTSEADRDHLQAIIDKKNAHIEDGAKGWFTALLSGMLGNWLVGLAAFFASKGRTLPGKLFGIALPVTAFVSLGVQHSPANMGYMSLGMVHDMVVFKDAYLWNIIPAAIGNIFGAVLFVVFPLWYMHFHKEDKTE
jgi:formate/nitrite transporter FocA (FNT family)